MVIAYFVVRLLPELLPGKAKKAARPLTNAGLLLASMGFYIWGSGRYVLILLTSIAANYIWGLLVHLFRERKIGKAIFAGSIIFNIGFLFWFKYFNFFLENIQALSYNLLGHGISTTIEVVLPIGISFYTFQAMSYVIDVYKGEIAVQKNPFKLALYISFFPQLIAGPIVRYSDVAADIDHRKESLDDFYQGFCRFVIGLSKKVLIADILATPVDSIFSLSTENLTFTFSWVAVFFYTLEIYFDFAGYSDMAIGMARMFGFHFKENFLLPYTAKNVTEFWRKWHISLSSFLRDYVYIPLGGNRRGTARTYLNLGIVFLLCGIWHGAAWTFVIWGVYHGFWLIVERILKNKKGFAMKGIPGQAVTFFLVMLGWTIFRAGSLAQLDIFLRAMFGMGQASGFAYYKLSYFVTPLVAFSALVGLVISVVPFTKIKEWLDKSWGKGILCLGLLVLCMVFMADASFNSFIYFKF
jgi:alginate O-acetyltransferase complex protein AlgI